LTVQERFLLLQETSNVVLVVELAAVMKLLESSSFEAVNSALFVENGDARIVGRY
jgi:hypothetical protein